MNYQELIEDHARIDELARELELAVQSATLRNGEVDRLLPRLARVVEQHLQKEDSFIYPELIGADDPAGATGIVLEFDAIKRDWEIYLGLWRGGVSGQDWPAFCESTVGMLGRLRERVMTETGLLYAMALREGLITMRAPH